MQNSLNICEQSFLLKLKAIVGSNNVVTNKTELEEFLQEKRGNFKGKSCVAVTPTNKTQVAEIVKLCNSLNVKIVTQGGNSSLVGSTVSDKNELILSLKKINKITDIKGSDFTIIADAGVKLKTLQEECKKHNLFFPFDIPSREICTLGGLASTNAGGINALKYGVFKDMVQGVEVVLADGTIINDLHSNKKRNIGASLSPLFLGAEGLNGVILSLSLKCLPLKQNELSFVASSCNVKCLLEFYSFVYTNLFDFIESFELMNKSAFLSGLKCAKITDIEQNILESNWVAIIKLTTSNKFIDLSEITKKTLKDFKNKNVKIIENTKQANKVWQARNLIHKGQKEQYKHSFKHDLAVPISKIQDLIVKGSNSCKEINQNLVPLLFGHAGDGNIHFNLCTNENLSNDAKNDIFTKLKEKLFATTIELGGTFSAEHGIGLLNKDFLLKYHSKHNEILLKIKDTLDSKHTLNNGKTVVKLWNF